MLLTVLFASGYVRLLNTTNLQIWTHSLFLTSLWCPEKLSDLPKVFTAAEGRPAAVVPAGLTWVPAPSEDLDHLLESQLPAVNNTASLVQRGLRSWKIPSFPSAEALLSTVRNKGRANESTHSIARFGYFKIIHTLLNFMLQGHHFQPSSRFSWLMTTWCALVLIHKRGLPCPYLNTLEIL